jgi:NitT/TauT family transport system ATP-binding protein
VTPISCNKTPIVKLSGVSKQFEKSSLVLDNINLTVSRGELVTLFGPNGCGKTTLLNLIAGVSQPTQGRIFIDGLPPNKTKIGYVFQNYRDSLLPWRTNLDNICFPLELEKVSVAERQEKAIALVQEFCPNIPLDQYPYQSSGGEQQLIAFLREVIAKPKIILMDEPFSALNQESRGFLRLKVQEIWKKMDLTIIFVTHDLSEALQLADRLFVMHSKSARLENEFRIQAKRPRTQRWLDSEYFKKLEKKVLARLRGNFGHEKE